MKLEDTRKIIEDSDMVLIGIGEEFEEGIQFLESSNTYKIFKKKLEAESLEEENYIWMYPYLLKRALEEEEIQNRVKEAYHVLLRMLEHKNYFIVTMNMDDMIHQIGFQSDRIVAPFGNYHIYQCENGCDDKIWEDRDGISAMIDSIVGEHVLLKDVKQPICPVCGAKVVFNTINSNRYLEQGYLDNWKKYTMWLQGTLNKKLCIVEMGVSLNFPSVIRWPFEKTAFYNQKSTFIRINSKLPQLTDDIKDRGISVKGKAVDFLLEEFV